MADWWVRTTGLCNNNCLTCIDGPEVEKHHRPGREVRAAIDRGRSEGAEVIVFHGGECTIDPGLPEYVGYAERAGYRGIQIRTNGRVLAYRSYAAKLKECGLTGVRIGVYGHAAELHDAHTRTESSFAQLQEGIRNSIALSMDTSAEIFLSERNAEPLIDIIDFLAGFGITRMVLTNVAPQSVAAQYRNPLYRNPARFLPHVLAASDHAGERSIELHLENIPRGYVEAYRTGALPYRGDPEPTILVNFVCNQDCLFCNTDAYAENLIPDRNIILNTLEQWRDRGAATVRITGREPTLDPHLMEYLEACSKLGLGTDLQTNAVVLAERSRAERLVEAGVSRFFVSFHAHREALYNEITGSETYHLAVSGLENLLALNATVDLNVVVCSLNYRALEGIVSFVHERLSGVNEVTFSIVAPVARAWENRWLIPSIAEIQEPLMRALARCTELGVPFRVAGRCGIPPCFLGDFADRHDELLSNRPCDMLDKTKIEKCDRCDFTDRCSGLWERYVTLHGFG